MKLPSSLNLWPCDLTHFINLHRNISTDWSWPWLKLRSRSFHRRCLSIYRVSIESQLHSHTAKSLNTGLVGSRFGWVRPRYSLINVSILPEHPSTFTTLRIITKTLPSLLDLVLSEIWVRESKSSSAVARLHHLSNSRRVRKLLNIQPGGLFKWGKKAHRVQL